MQREKLHRCHFASCLSGFELPKLLHAYLAISLGLVQVGVSKFHLHHEVGWHILKVCVRSWFPSA